MSHLQWKIEQVITVNQLDDEGGVTHENVVREVHWRVFFGEATAYGSEVMPFDPAEEFTSFADLTEAQVIGWVQTAIGAERLATIEASLAPKESITPPLPWAPPVEGAAE